MRITIAWRHNEKTEKWNIIVMLGVTPITLVIRNSEEECKSWAARALPFYQKDFNAIPLLV